ncbi:MAG TPA: response regulator [Isosphaeraceae bacterium]|jgi:DNA-binding response OmpR family regulator|nr:response regulator [Isosphaeraceae bacterium]
MSGQANILIIDDEPNVRLVFRTALESAGHIAAEAVDGEAGLMWLRGFPADLVLLDLQMPRLGGLKMLETLRHEGNDVPVVIITAHGSVPDAVAAMKLGAIDFLAKPVSPRALRKIVAEVLARHATPKQKDAPDPSHESQPVTVADQYAEHLRRAKKALNQRAFEEAEIFLRQAIALMPESAEAHNLMGVLHECRNEHDASYAEYRAALKADHHYEPAKHNMKRYYERYTFGHSDIPVDTGRA